MRPLQTYALAALLPLSILVAACGDSGDGDGGGGGDAPDLPSAIVTVQEQLDIEAWEAEIASDGELAAIATSLPVSRTGVTEDSDGVRVTWGAAPDGTTAIRRCDDAGCTYGSWSPGGALPVAPMGRPALLKNVDGFDAEGKTVVVSSALSATASVELTKADLPSLDYGTRELRLLNAYGPAFGTTLSGVEQSAGDAYERTTNINYASEADVLSALAELDGMDAVVWLGAGVRVETQGGGAAFRTVGVSVNAGVFGDATLTGARLQEATRLNVGGGPGLVVLLGSNTYSDGTDGQPDNDSLWERLIDGEGILIGVRGSADVADQLAAAQRLFAALATSDDVDAALARANDGLPAGAEFRVGRDAQRWPVSSASVWASKPLTPSTVQVTLPVTAVPYCAPAGQPKQPGTASFTTAFADVTFDGASFEGRRTFDGGGLSVDTTIVGTVTGFEVGDRVYVELFGTFDGNVSDFHGFGVGTIREVETDDDGVFTASFNGLAHTTEYTNDSGEECILNNPQLSTTTSGFATIKFTP